MKLIFGVLGIVLLWSASRQIEKRYRTNRNRKLSEETKKEKVYELLKTAKDLKRWDKNGYTRETADLIHSHDEKIDEHIDKLITMEDYEVIEKEVQRLIQETESLSDSIKQGHAESEALLKEMKRRLTFIKEYLDSTNFYPPQFAMDNNKLSGMILEIEERKNANPLLNLEKYREFAHEFYEQVIQFQSLHRDIAALIEKFDHQKDTLTSDKKQKVYEDKNDLYIALHKAEWEEVKTIKQRIEKNLL